MSGENVKLFVGNLPLDATQDELNKLFSPFGEINTCSLLRQYAFVTLKGEGAADKAIRHLDGKEYRGRPLVVEESRARPPNSTKVFVGNLSATCSADDLHGLFSTFGRVLDCDKVKARLCSNVGYAFVHMERKEDAMTAIEALNGTLFKGRQLAVELSKAQPLANQLMSSGGGREGLLPRPSPSMEHHQSQAAVLAAAAAAAAGLPIQVQQSVHNSFYNTTSFDPTYAALRGITSSKGADGVIYGALASQVYGTVADQVYQDMTNHHAAPVSVAAEPELQPTPDPTTLFEAARAKFFQEGQKVLAEQQAGKKATGTAASAENERDRSPIRGNRAPLLPDPVPGSFAQIKSKRRTLLPTPPGASEDASTAATTADASDPVARSYSEYYQQLHQYQQYQQYQQQYQYLQYAYSNPPPPPPSSTPDSNAVPPPPGTYTAPPTYGASGAYPPPGTYDATASYDASAAGYNASSASYNTSTGSYDASAGYAAGAYDSSGAYAAAGAYSTSTPYEQTPAHGQSMPQRHDYPHTTPEPPYR
ncbi:RNA-binding protein 14a isoform X1 [Synchiropus splendidus]|uniref:RNA-binding protein 14a isoform X1 n=2 Tax=Synchiropus splendidus TaxID=270530 RepID=UPI00237E94B5|nr:RNA-binding protein 14a isoform X1 [Synchiropus splendidus]